MHIMRVYMTQRYEMICCAHDLLPDHAQKLLKTKKEETYLSLNLIFFYFFQISTFWSGHIILIILYSTNIFRKKLLFFDHFQTLYIFF